MRKSVSRRFGAGVQLKQVLLLRRLAWCITRVAQRWLRVGFPEKPGWSAEPRRHTTSSGQTPDRRRECLSFCPKKEDHVPQSARHGATTVRLAAVLILCAKLGGAVCVATFAVRGGCFLMSTARRMKRSSWRREQSGLIHKHRSGLTAKKS